MRILSKAKDGGPESPVDAYFIIEAKKLFSICILKFNKGGREAYHTHAFNALTWFLRGELYEENFDGTTLKYKRSLWPKITKRDKNHRVFAARTSWCISIRGPWKEIWTEHRDGKEVFLTHGRKEIQ